jgi:hypothetical protein
VFLAASLLVATGIAAADPAVNATQLTCVKVQAAIRASGSAIVHYSKPGAGNRLYSRYVSDSRFCDSGETAVFARVPTADNKSCPVKRCQSVY